MFWLMPAPHILLDPKQFSKILLCITKRKKVSSFHSHLPPAFGIYSGKIYFNDKFSTTEKPSLSFPFPHSLINNYKFPGLSQSGLLHILLSVLQMNQSERPVCPRNQSSIHAESSTITQRMSRALILVSLVTYTTLMSFTEQTCSSHLSGRYRDMSTTMGKTYLLTSPG